MSQVGEAVTQMDQDTHENAELVEQMAAAARSLRNQADDLLRGVSVFKLDDVACSESGSQVPDQLALGCEFATKSLTDACYWPTVAIA